jgi:hypothetical protein
MSFSGFTQITTAQINTPSIYSNNMALGTLGADRRGEIYAWSYAGAVALNIGKVNIAPAKVANDTNRSLAAVSNIALGSTKVTVSGGGTVAVDAYAGGYLIVNDGTGKGQRLQITSNTPDYVSGSDTHAVDVTLHDGLFVALSLSDTKVILEANPNLSVVVAPGDASTYFCVGVNETAVAATTYFYAKVRGVSSVLSDGVVAKGTSAILSPSIAGALVTEGTSGVVKRVAYAPEATVDAKYYPLFMDLL